MSTARYLIGDVREVLRTLPDDSVDLVLSSPPFLALRSYLPADHPDKAKEMGSEPTPGAFIDALLDVTEECRRVLAPHGSLVFELGDTYAGSGGAGGDYGEGGLRDGQAKFRQRTDGGRYVDGYSGGSKGHDVAASNGAFDVRPIRGREGWPLDKSLTLIPEIFRFALVYGFNPLTGRTTERWRARNVIRWCRPNPPVGALGDKVRPATSDMVVACVGRRRYFDLDAVRTDYKFPNQVRAALSNFKDNDNQDSNRKTLGEFRASESAGAPPLDHWWYDDTFDQDAWLQSTEPYPGSHYATWPRDLLVKPILAMCPPKVCRACGRASERVTQPSEAYAVARRNMADTTAAEANGSNKSNPDRLGRGLGHVRTKEVPRVLYDVETLGWTDCGHDDWRPGLILDPFGGSGTTAVVATGHGRDCILIDIDSRNAELAQDRVGMFLTIDEVATP